MKCGIYYAYWEKEWSNNFLPYIGKCKELGFDILEIGCGAFYQLDDSFFVELGKKAKENNIILTGGYGPRKEHNMASEDSEELEKTFAFYEDMFRKMQIAGIDRIGGALYSYWPVDYSKVPAKEKDFANSVKNMQTLADIAAKYNITLKNTKHIPIIEYLYFISVKNFSKYCSPNSKYSKFFSTGAHKKMISQLENAESGSKVLFVIKPISKASVMVLKRLAVAIILQSG